MINSTKESRVESLLRKICNSVKEIEEAVEKLEKLSAQPEIIHCGECARRKTMCDGRDRCTMFNVIVDSDGYCKWAEGELNDR